MDTVKITEQARALLDARGDKAEAEAAQKAATLRAAGKSDEAAQWDKVRKAIHELRSGYVTRELNSSFGHLADTITHRIVQPKNPP